MIRLTILLLTFGTLVYGQDSTFVNETCKRINKLPNPSDKEGQNNLIYEQSTKYIPTLVSNVPREKVLKATYTFQYRLNRELKRTCPKFLLDKVPIKAQRVIDFEDKFSKSEIDSLKGIMNRLGTEQNVYVYLVTIDDYFPDKNIEEFSNRNREYWGHGQNFEKGTILISISVAKRQFRISTGDRSMKYLTDDECSEINKIMVPYFKKNEHFKGLVEGLSQMKSRL